MSFPLGPCQFGTRYGNMVLGITAEPMQDAEARKRALNSEFLDFQRDRDGWNPWNVAGNLHENIEGIGRIGELWLHFFWRLAYKINQFLSFESKHCPDDSSVSRRMPVTIYQDDITC